MISDRQKDELRKILEIQFRYQFYQDPKFPFLQSMGCKHVFQAFVHPDKGDLGTLHLYWVKGTWKSKWHDDESEVIELVVKLFEDIKIDKMHRIHEEFRQTMFMNQKGAELLKKYNIPQNLLN